MSAQMWRSVARRSPFYCCDKGVLEMSGGGVALAEVGESRLSGLGTWLSWRTIHIFSPRGLQPSLVRAERARASARGARRAADNRRGGNTAGARARLSGGPTPAVARRISSLFEHRARRKSCHADETLL